MSRRNRRRSGRSNVRTLPTGAAHDYWSQFQRSGTRTSSRSHLPEWNVRNLEEQDYLRDLKKHATARKQWEERIQRAQALQQKYNRIAQAARYARNPSAPFRLRSNYGRRHHRP